MHTIYASLMVIISTYKAEECFNKHYEIISENGPPLRPDEVISSHKVSGSVQIECNFLCYQEPKCVRFNFRGKNSDENCQLSHETKSVGKSMQGYNGDWTLFRDVEAAKSSSGILPEKSCEHFYKSGKRKDGVYTIDPDRLGSFQVWCDMDRNSGGWTVFQRRLDASLDFYRDWREYKDGFGDLNGNFWLGLDKIHRLTKSNGSILKVDFMDFENETAYAKYEEFSVSSEFESYRLNVGNFSGDAGDSLFIHNGMMFTTKDKDNDMRNNGNCARLFNGAWWYNKSHESNLNGLYITSGRNYCKGINWYSWKKDCRSMKKVVMKIRRT